MRLVLTCAAAWGLATVVALGAEAPPSFTKKPTAAKSADGKVKIEFAVSRETDVSVFIEDSGGKVVRHLVSGVLGKNPPAPLSSGLAQSVEWDGQADWGKPAGSGPFKARVALGLGAKYDKAVIADPMAIGGVLQVAAGPDGTLYAVVAAGAGVANWSGQRLVALNRDSSFQRTLIPLPSTATKEQIAAMGSIPIEVGGRTVPAYLDLPQRRNTVFWSNDGAAMTADGKFLTLHPDARIVLVDTTNSASPPPCLGPKLLPSVPGASFFTIDHRQYLAVSADGKSAYFSGIAPKRRLRPARRSTGSGSRSARQASPSSATRPRPATTRRAWAATPTGWLRTARAACWSATRSTSASWPSPRPTASWPAPSRRRAPNSSPPTRRAERSICSRSARAPRRRSSSSPAGRIPSRWPPSA